jgi:molybdopterin-guanine dinucleotide biosynthesis protein A
MLSGVLLAGGRSRRMGADKALIKLKGKELYTFGLELLSGFCEDILISAPEGLVHHDTYPVISDEFPGKGPMGGIVTCMKKAIHPWCLILSCDMPFMDPQIIRLLIREMENDYCVPCGKSGHPEPLAGIYSRNLTGLFEEMIHTGDLKIQNLLTRSKGRIIDLNEQGIDPGRSFFNINTPGDLRKAEWTGQE